MELQQILSKDVQIMRNLSDLTKEEISKIADLTGDNGSNGIKSSIDVEYRVFGKSRSIYSGYTVVLVYKYLLTIGIDIW